jgi:hypothetical protein
MESKLPMLTISALSKRKCWLMMNFPFLLVVLAITMYLVPVAGLYQVAFPLDWSLRREGLQHVQVWLGVLVTIEEKAISDFLEIRW